MRYEVYLPTDSIGLDSKTARGEYVAIPCQKGGEEYNERGSVSLIKGGGNYLRGRFSANSLNIFFSCYSVYLYVLYPCCFCKFLGLCFMQVCRLYSVYHAFIQPLFIALISTSN